MKTIIYSLINSSILLVMIFLSSCADKVTEDTSLYPETSYQAMSIDDANGAFASILAKAIANKDIKDFIKQEALKEVDRDYDVIYQLVKNSKLKNGLTFRETLAQYGINLSDLDNITEKDPTLTILVPYLDSTFNALNWDTENQSISGIVLRNQYVSKEITHLKYYRPNGDIQFIERSEKPEKPVLVVKSNERLISSKDKSTTKSDLSNSLSNEDGVFAFFIGEEINNLSPQTKGPVTSNYGTDLFLRNEKNFYTFFNKTAYCRDYVYYNIDTDKNVKEGDLDRNYAEYLIDISFIDQNSGYDYVADAFDPNGDWSDGNLEIYLDILLNKRDGTSFPFRKIVNIPMQDVFKQYGNGRLFDGKHQICPPLELFTWNAYEYGDMYKISVSEWDNGSEITHTHTVTSTYSTNFSTSTENKQGDHKTTTSTGNTNTFSVTNTISVKTTNNTDDLGSTLIYFYDRTFGDKIALYSRGIPRYESDYYTSNEQTRFYNDFNGVDLNVEKFYGAKSYSTGIINLSMLPLRRN